MVKLSPTALKFGYDLVLLVHFLGHPVHIHIKSFLSNHFVLNLDGNLSWTQVQKSKLDIIFFLFPILLGSRSGEKMWSLWQNYEMRMGCLWLRILSVYFLPNWKVLLRGKCHQKSTAMHQPPPIGPTPHLLFFVFVISLKFQHCPTSMPQSSKSNLVPPTQILGPFGPPKI